MKILPTPVLKVAIISIQLYNAFGSHRFYIVELILYVTLATIICKYQKLKNRLSLLILDNFYFFRAAPNYRVDADKGFNFSTADDAFVCQKKNHFQITCHVQLPSEVVYARAGDGSIQKIVGFHLHFYGVKVESPTQTIKVEQSQSDRSKKPFHPVL